MSLTKSQPRNGSSVPLVVDPSKCLRTDYVQGAKLLNAPESFTQIVFQTTYEACLKNDIF